MRNNILLASGRGASHHLDPETLQASCPNSCTHHVLCGFLMVTFLWISLLSDINILFYMNTLFNFFAGPAMLFYQQTLCFTSGLV